MKLNISAREYTCILCVCIYALWTHNEVNITLKLERENNILLFHKQCIYTCWYIHTHIYWAISEKSGHGHTYNPSIILWEPNLGRWQFGGQSEIHAEIPSKTLPQTSKKKKIKIIREKQKQLFVYEDPSFSLLSFSLLCLYKGHV